MTDHEPRCHFAGHDYPRMLRAHAPGCDTATCTGCAPCPERHCQVCDHAHVTVDGRGTDETCASCIYDTRTALADTLSLSARLLGEAIRRGINSQAAMLDGPAADPETWGYRRMSALAQRIDPAWLEDNRDELHPAWVIGTWEMLTRDHLHQPIDTRLTLTEAVAYLDQHLTRLAHDPDFDFTALARDVARCHAHLEDVLAEGVRPERGAPCPACGRADLEKNYGDTVNDDRWTCTRCGQWWTEQDYRSKVAGTYIAVAPALTASQIREQYHVPEGSIRAWATRGRVAKKGRDHLGRQLYVVADVLACRTASAS